MPYIKRMEDFIKDGKLVELTYQLTDLKSGQLLNKIEFPINYVHGHNNILAPKVLAELEGKTSGDTIKLTIDCDEIFGPRDETLVFTDSIENVPQEFRKIGTTISMENKKGEIRNFVVTHLNEKTLTVDGNNPLCGRNVIFTLEVLNVRNATRDEIEAGGKDNDYRREIIDLEFISGIKASPID